MVRFMVRVALAAAITAIGANFLAAFVLVEAAAVGNATSLSEVALAVVAGLFYGAIIGCIALGVTFVPAAAAAGVLGGLLWRVGRDAPEGRKPVVWAGLGGVSGAAVSVFALWMMGETLSRDAWMIACGVVAGAVAAIVFRALMSLLPPWPEPGEDGGWERT